MHYHCLRNEKNDPLDNSNLSSNSSLLKTSLPIMLIFSILALLPSSTTILIPSLFLGFIISSISTPAPYLPLDA
jgi:hypothetical protein